MKEKVKTGKTSKYGRQTKWTTDRILIKYADKSWLKGHKVERKFEEKSIGIDDKGAKIDDKGIKRP